MIELMGVVVIIGILMIFILTAAMDGREAAKQAATRGLVSKLDTGMNTLIEALTQARPQPLRGVPGSPGFHELWAQVYLPNGVPMGTGFNDRAIAARAQVLATYDYLRHSLPDTWFVQDATLNNPNGYPINFAQQPYVSNQGLPQWDNVVPIGANVGVAFPTPGIGIYGATYSAAAGLYKNLGNLPISAYPNAVPLLPQGYDGVDNDFGSVDMWGLIDNIHEGLQGNPAVTQAVKQSLTNHQHITARSEMLYALLVEGQGQFGAIFNRDDFAPNEIADTDQDGLPEFVDAWGNPLQYFRWPVYYSSDVQKGMPVNLASSSTYYTSPPYRGPFETREQDPIDPNQQLTSVAWWSSVGNVGPGNIIPNFPSASGSASAAAVAFELYYHSLSEPTSFLGPNAQHFWDRSVNPGFFPRRAFYTRHLILSAGPDGVPGVPIANDAAITAIFNSGAQNPVSAVAMMLQFEGQAAQFDLTARMNAPSIAPDFTSSNTTPIDSNTGVSYLDEGDDDITNHNLNSTAGSAQ
jgi:hypothetical protein